MLHQGQIKCEDIRLKDPKSEKLKRVHNLPKHKKKHSPPDECFFLCRFFNKDLFWVLLDVNFYF